eukprot:jgi/Bigna1/84731/fgenesh1_pg.252_\
MCADKTNTHAWNPIPSTRLREDDMHMANSSEMLTSLASKLPPIDPRCPAIGSDDDDVPANKREEGRRGGGEQKGERNSGSRKSEGKSGELPTGTYLKLDGCQIGAFGAEALFSSIFTPAVAAERKGQQPSLSGAGAGKGDDKDGASSACFVRRLDLSNNAIGDEGIECLTRSLEKNGKLLRDERALLPALAIADNNIGEQSFVPTSHCVGGGPGKTRCCPSVGCSLERLICQDCDLRDKGVRRLVQAINKQRFHNLTHIDLRQNSIDKKLLQKLNQAINEGANSSMIQANANPFACSGHGKMLATARKAMMRRKVIQRPGPNQKPCGELTKEKVCYMPKCPEDCQ